MSHSIWIRLAVAMMNDSRFEALRANPRNN
jgi:hypothetical protein